MSYIRVKAEVSCIGVRAEVSYGLGQRWPRLGVT